MVSLEPRPPVQPGEPAPDFTLSALHREGEVSLGDYRGRIPVLLALFRGLYCPFCRRSIAQLSVTNEKLLAAGAAVLAIVATKPERARLYFRFHPARVAMAADPGLITHRSFGLPNRPITPELMETLQSLRFNPTGELPEPLPMEAAAPALNALDGFELTPTDHEDSQRQGYQFLGQFLVDRDGVVRWANIECGKEGLPGFGKPWDEDELLAAVRALNS